MCTETQGFDNPSVNLICLYPKNSLKFLFFFVKNRFFHIKNFIFFIYQTLFFLYIKWEWNFISRLQIFYIKNSIFISKIRFFISRNNFDIKNRFLFISKHRILDIKKYLFTRKSAPHTYLPRICYIVGPTLLGNGYKRQKICYVLKGNLLFGCNLLNGPFWFRPCTFIF